MGTSHRHTPTIKGDPNWGKASSAVSGLVGAVSESDALDKNPPTNMTPSQISKRQSALGKRINRGYHSAVRNLIRAAGGRGKVSSGGSKAIGRAGIYVAGGLVATFSEIVSNGLSEWLHKKGVISLEGKQCKDIVDIIRQYIETGIAGLDDTAANEALECVLDNLEERMGDDVDAFDDVMNQIMSGDAIKDMLDLFFGMYVFSHLSQDFEEKLEYERGTEAMKNAMNEIKDQILDDIHTSRSGQDAISIDWSKPEGEDFIKTEFNRILYILQGNED